MIASNLAIDAPATVGAVSAHPGQHLQAGQTVLSLLPMAGESASGTVGGARATVTTSASAGTAGNSAAAALQAKLYAPSRTSGFVEPGQAVSARVKLLVASSSGHRAAIAARDRSGDHLRSFWVEGHGVDVRPVARGA